MALLERGIGDKRFLLLGALALSLFFAILSAKVSLFSGAPSGWDYFYHERVVSLSIEQGSLIPFDPLSAGGRNHTYLPFFYSLVSSTCFSTGLSPETVLRLSSPFFLFLAGVSIFVFSKRTFGSLLAVAFFASFPEILLFSASSGMPSVASLFFLSILVFSIVSEKFLSFPILALLSISLGSLHQISAVSFAIFALALSILRKSPRVFSLGALSISIPLAWALIFRSTIPNWGIAPGLPSLSSPPFPIHILLPILIVVLDFFFIGKSREKALAIGLLFSFLALSFFSPILPSRFLLYLGFFLALSVSLVGWKPWFVILASIGLAVSAVGTLKWTEPILQPQDAEALFWIDCNAPGEIFLGHTDLTSVFLMGHAGTIVDGYSEGLPDAYERQGDIRAAYSTGNFSGISEKYGAKYLYTNFGEERLLGKFQKPEKAVLSNGYAEIFIISEKG